MKILAKILTAVVLFLVFSVFASAKEAEDYIEDFKEILPQESADRFDSSEMVSSIGPEAVLSELICAFDERRGDVVEFLLLLFAGVMLMTLSSTLEGELSSVAEAGVGAIVALLVFSRMSKIFAEVSEAVSALSAFFSAFVPIAVGVTAASGGVNTAFVQHSGMNITLWFLSGVGAPVFTSVVGFGLAASMLASFGDEWSASVAKSVKGFFVFCVGVVSAVLGATLSLQTVIASAADSAAIRAARYAATGFIPVVGAAVSGALSTLVSGLTYAKSMIGAGGIAVILLTSLSPLVMLLLYRLAILCASFFAELCGKGGAARIIGALKFSIDSMIALYTVSALTYIIEIVMFMKGGVSW